MDVYGALRDEAYGIFQDLTDALFRHASSVSRRDLVLLAEMHDLAPDVMEVVELMPSGSYTRRQFSDQLNSIITAHGWGMRYGTVD